MKHLFTVLFISLSLAGFAQNETSPIIPRNPETGKVEYSDIQEVPGVTKDQLFSRAQSWVANTFRSAKAVTELSDKESGRIIAKGQKAVVRRILGNDTHVGDWDFRLTIDSKEGKYRAVFSNIYMTVSSGMLSQTMTAEESFEKPAKSKQAIANYEKFNNDFRGLLASLQKAMNTKPDDF